MSFAIRRASNGGVKTSAVPTTTSVGMRTFGSSRVRSRPTRSRDAADRMTDEHGPVQIETFEDGLDVASQVLQRVTFSSQHRATVTPMVEGDRAEALLRKLLELMEPGAHRQGHAVREDNRRIEL